MALFSGGTSAATNNDWAVPVGIGDRRFFILDCSNAKKGDTAYFKKLGAFIKDEGGQEAFIHYLAEEVNLDDFEVRNIPEINSATKLDHKVRTADSITKWWLESLTEGGFETASGFVQWESAEPLSIPIDDFYQSYCIHAGNGHKEAKSSLSKKVAELLNLDKMKVEQSRSAGRKRHYRLPSLSVARLSMEKHLGQHGPWWHEDVIPDETSVLAVD